MRLVDETGQTRERSGPSSMRGSGPEEVFWSHYGRLAQRESTALTTQGSLVRTQHRPRRESAGQPPCSMALNMRTCVQAAAKSNKNPTSERSLRAIWRDAKQQIQQIQRARKSNISNTLDESTGCTPRLALLVANRVACEPLWVLAYLCERARQAHGGRCGETPRCPTCAATDSNPRPSD